QRQQYRIAGHPARRLRRLALAEGLLADVERPLRDLGAADLAVAVDAELGHDVERQRARQLTRRREHRIERIDAAEEPRRLLRARSRQQLGGQRLAALAIVDVEELGDVARRAVADAVELLRERKPPREQR